MANIVSRVFMNGNSQAVRIPKEFRLEANRVEIHRNRDGDLVIHPIAEKRGAALMEALAGFDDDYVELLEQDREQQPPMQEREAL